MVLILYPNGSLLVDGSLREFGKEKVHVRESVGGVSPIISSCGLQRLPTKASNKENRRVVQSEE